MTAARAGVLALLLLVAQVLQTSVLSHAAWHGVAPNIVLLVVVAAGLARGSELGMVVGVAGGLLLDLAPPADHVAGRWALALLVVGYVAGRIRTSPRPAPGQALVTVAACSFVGSSVFALTGVVLRDPLVDVPALLEVVLVGVVADLVLALLVLPAVLAVLRRLEPDRVPDRVPA